MVCQHPDYQALVKLTTNLISVARVLAPYHGKATEQHVERIIASIMAQIVICQARRK